MWANKHLKATPIAEMDEEGQAVVEVGAHRKDIVEKLEKAHIYIEQLHNRNKELNVKNEALEARVSALEKAIGQLISHGQ